MPQWAVLTGQDKGTANRQSPLSILSAFCFLPDLVVGMPVSLAIFRSFKEDLGGSFHIGLFISCIFKPSFIISRKSFSSIISIGYPWSRKLMACCSFLPY